jgi:hypothetical protein
MNNEQVDLLLAQAVREAEPNELYKYRFAKVVAAAEREECAKVLDEMAAADRLSNYYQVAALRIRERGAP